MEQFDKSSASWNVPLERDWRTINSALSVPRYEMAVASVPVSKVKARTIPLHNTIFLFSASPTNYINIHISTQVCNDDII